MIRQVSDLYSQTEATAREQEENGLLDEQGENFKVWTGSWLAQMDCGSSKLSAQSRRPTGAEQHVFGSANTSVELLLRDEQQAQQQAQQHGYPDQTSPVCCT